MENWNSDHKGMEKVEDIKAKGWGRMKNDGTEHGEIESRTDRRERRGEGEGEQDSYEVTGFGWGRSPGVIPDRKSVV